MTDPSNVFPTSGHDVLSEEDAVDAVDAVDSLEKVKSMMKLRLLGEEELLDLTAEALDVGALCLKFASLKNKDDGGSQDNNAGGKDDLIEVVRRLSIEVLIARGELLASFTNKCKAAALSGGRVSPLTDSPDEEEVEGSRSEAPLVVWATHTGTSRTLAYELMERLGTGARVKNIKNLTLSEVKRHTTVLFVVSTFGIGRPPRDGEAFFESLKSADAGSLEGVSFAVASLGNTAFEHFAVFGKKLAYELAQKGANELVPVADMDRRRGKKAQEEQFLVWERKMVDIVDEEANGKGAEVRARLA